MNNLTPAELKTRQRQTRSILGSSFAALLIIALAFSSTFFEFKSLAANITFAAVIVASSLFILIFMIRYFSGMDEFERSINANASLIALFSSMTLLPWTYLHKLGYLPEINVYFGFMFMWFIYLISMIFYSCK